jgi:hypothetical protein
MTSPDKHGLLGLSERQLNALLVATKAGTEAVALTERVSLGYAIGRLNKAKKWLRKETK